jgi:glycosyltransferase involved in cell wall biosynthesis
MKKSHDNKTLELTIAIPVYNCSQYLKSGFEKLLYLYSTDISFEIIYVNDGSTDDSLAVLKELESKHLFVKLISQENQGLSGARNTAIDIAQGRYIQFLDADDYLDIEQLILLLEVAKKKSLDAISYRLDYTNEHDEKIGERPKQTVTFNKIISGQQALIEGFNPSSICVFLFKIEFLNTNNLRITPKITHNDVEFTSRMMLVANKIMFVDLVLYHYLQREGSITKPLTIDKFEKVLFDEITVSKNIKKTLELHFSNDLKYAIQKNYNSVVWNLLWRFIRNSKEIDYKFKSKCLEELKTEGLYPIRGKMKTNFQRISTYFFNREYVLKFLIK